MLIRHAHFSTLYFPWLTDLTHTHMHTLPCLTLEGISVEDILETLIRNYITEDLYFHHWYTNRVYLASLNKEWTKYVKQHVADTGWQTVKNGEAGSKGANPHQCRSLQTGGSFQAGTNMWRKNNLWGQHLVSCLWCLLFIWTLACVPDVPLFHLAPCSWLRKRKQQRTAKVPGPLPCIWETHTRL